MFIGIDGSQIFWPVVVANPVNVMNVFMPLEWSAENLFHNSTMFEDGSCASSRRDKNIPTSIEPSSSAPVGVQRSEGTAVIASLPTRNASAPQSVKDGLCGQADGTADNVRRLASLVTLDQENCGDRLFVYRIHGDAFWPHNHTNLNQARTNTASRHRYALSNSLKTQAGGVEVDEFTCVDNGSFREVHADNCSTYRLIDVLRSNF